MNFQKNCNHHGSDHLIKKTDENDSTAGSGSPRTTCHDNIDAVADLVQSQENSSHLSAYIHVNGGYFKHKFWTDDFLVYFVRYIAIAFPKFDQYKHVQSANIAWNVSETFTRYSSNRMKEIVTSSTLAFSCKAVHKKIWKSVYICKSYSDKVSGTFLCGESVEVWALLACIWAEVSQVTKSDSQSSRLTEISPARIIK